MTLTWFDRRVLLRDGAGPDECPPLIAFRRFRILVGCSLAMLLLMVGLILWTTQRAARQQLADCVDKRGDVAVRHQWQRVEQIYGDLQSGKVTADQARDQFVATYQIALDEAGDAPPCILHEDARQAR